MHNVVPLPIADQAGRTPSTVGDAQIFRMAAARARRTRLRRAADRALEKTRADLLDWLDKMKGEVLSRPIEGLFFIVQLPHDDLRAGAVGAPFLDGKRLRAQAVVSALDNIRAEVARDD